MQIREMLSSDIDEVVKIHNKAFYGFFLTRMGYHFLRAYYQTVLDFEASIALVAYDHGRKITLGFAVGFCKPQEFYVLFKQKRKHILPIILLAILRDPGLLSQILHNTRRVEQQAQQPFYSVELSSIAVGERGKGIGSALLKAFVSNANLKGEKKIALTTDAEGNDSVRRFYEERGFKLDGFESRGGRQLCCYVLELG